MTAPLPEQTAERLLRVDPYGPERHEAAQVADVLQDSVRRADRALSSALHARSNAVRGHNREARRELAEVEAAFDEAEPMVQWAWANLTGLLEDDDRHFATAIARFRQAIAIASDAGLTRERGLSAQNLALSAARLGEQLPLRSALVEVARFGANTRLMHETLAEIFEIFGDWESAVAHYRLEREADGGSRSTLVREARTLTSLGESAAALELLGLLDVHDDPDEARIRSGADLVRARIQLETDPESSARIARDLLELADRHGYFALGDDLRLTLAECALRQAEPELALEHIDRLEPERLAINTESARHELRARCLWDLGRKSEALAEHAEMRLSARHIAQVRNVIWETRRELVEVERELKIAAELDVLNRRLERAHTGMQIAAAELATELRSRIGVVKTALYSPAYPEVRGLVEPAIAQMNAIVNSAQRAVAIDEMTDPTDHAPAVFDLVEATRRSIRHFLPRARQRHQLLSATLPSDPVPLQGSALLATHIVDNLLANALAYTPAGGNIRLSIHLEGLTARIVVEDDGLGLSVGDEDRIFERFVVAAKPATGGATTGLGLYIVRSSAERLGGSVTARSNAPGPGSTFTVTMPVAPTSPARAPARPGMASE